MKPRRSLLKASPLPACCEPPFYDCYRLTGLHGRDCDSPELLRDENDILIHEAAEDGVRAVLGPDAVDEYAEDAP